MSLKDDKDGLSSSSRRLDRADGGKRDALKKQIKKTTGMEKQSDMQKVDLKADMDLQQLKNQLAGKSDEETKRKEDAQEQAKEESTTPKTKTLKEREEALEQDAHEDFDADAQIQREEAKQDLASEETKPEPG